jgi:hypothetical protein
MGLMLRMSPISEIDLLILFTRRRVVDTLIDKLINVVVKNPPSPSLSYLLAKIGYRKTLITGV